MVSRDDQRSANESSENQETTHSNTAVGNVTDERPSHTSIPTSIQVELGLGKVGRDRITGHENGTRWEATGGFVEVEEVWLVSHTPTVDRVLSQISYDLPRVDSPGLC